MWVNYSAKMLEVVPRGSFPCLDLQACVQLVESGSLLKNVCDSWDSLG